MWLSERAAARRAGAASAGTGKVSIGGAAPAVYTDGEHRALRVLAPMGMEWQLQTGDDALILETDDGERYVLGCPVTNGTAYDGVLRLRSGSTVLEVGPAGVSITGRLTVNGTQVPAEEA